MLTISPFSLVTIITIALVIGASPCILIKYIRICRALAVCPDWDCNIMSVRTVKNKLDIGRVAVSSILVVALVALTHVVNLLQPVIEVHDFELFWIQIVYTCGAVAYLITMGYLYCDANIISKHINHLICNGSFSSAVGKNGKSNTNRTAR